MSTLRIIQLSDIHLNQENLDELNNYYMDALVKDLERFIQEKKIDVIVITGDLVDKGGDSLGIDPYRQFHTVFVQPLIDKLNLASSQVLIIPGNHDVNREVIDSDIEYVLATKLTPDEANRRASAFHSEFNRDNLRIERFKRYEQQFHKTTHNYVYSNNESLAIVEVENKKVGFALINDSWRCSAELRKHQHFLGYKQLFRARNYFNEIGTVLNIAVFHHPLTAINEAEAQEIQNILKTKNFDVVFFGHSHRHSADKLASSNGGYLSINGRSAFSDPKQLSSDYQPGYNIVDIEMESRRFKITARKFIKSGYRFDVDTDALPGGIYEGPLYKDERLYPLAQDSNNDDKELPDSFTADVDRIVALLIGESIYPDKYAFVREIIQNSVDACNRVKEQNSYATPRITINIDSSANYFEVVDEGDGMTKSIIKNHFAVIGKSISQEHNDNSGHVNLISKFGIGFISTFIAAEKVLVNTKSEKDVLVSFEVDNVFKGFKYFQPPDNEQPTASGTSVRVYLKRNYSAQEAFQHVWQYCRHIDNLDVYLDGNKIPITNNWNTESTKILYQDTNERYELRLGLGEGNRPMIASYSGFLITYVATQILPFRFPSHIGGEVNFLPKGIDFDVSRTNIMPTGKAIEAKKEISLSIKQLFRNGLENGAQNLKNIIVGYLQYYIQHYDANHAHMQATHKDFFTKRELYFLCAENLLLDYSNSRKRLTEILAELRLRGIDKIYLQDTHAVPDHHAIIIQYLKSKGNLVISNTSQIVNFHDSTGNVVALSTVVQLIAAEYGISMVNIASVNTQSFFDMRMDKSLFPQKLTKQLAMLEATYGLNIEIGQFDSISKPSIADRQQRFLNYYHSAFQSLLLKMETMDDQALQLYLKGLLGLSLVE